MIRHIVLSVAAVFCFDLVASAQGVSVITADYTRVRNGEVVGAGTFTFADDGRVPHDRLNRDGEAAIFHIWVADGSRRVDIDHVLGTATVIDGDMVRDPTGALRISPSVDLRAGAEPRGGAGTETLPIGPRAVGPLVLDGFRADVPAGPGRPAVTMEVWTYRQPGHERPRMSWSESQRPGI